MRNAIVVFDTNILISGIGWQGAPYHCLELARNGIVTGVTCSELLEELMEKLTIKLKFSQQQAIDTLVDLLSFLRVVKISNTLKIIETDPDDNVVLECGLVSKATHIVTGDKRHLLPIGNYEGMAIVSANDFLALISSQTNN